MENSFVSEAHAIQMEISTKCNALCPSCVRTDDTTLRHVRSTIPKNKELSLEIFEQILNSEFIKKTKEIEFCGTLDEPLAHSQFIEICRLIADSPYNISIMIHTNGGLRNESYFAQLAEILAKAGEKSRIRFSIDGLGETNAVYRYQTQFERIHANLRAFLDAGGRAVWQTVVFPWNEHQVQEMRSMAKDMGCIAFFARPDRSFASQLGFEKIQEIRSSDVTPREAMPKGSKERMQKIFARLDREVSCIYKDERKMIYVSWDGLIWPCCFWGNARYVNEEKRSLMEKWTTQKYGDGFNDLYQQSLDDILKGALFQNDLVESWKNNSEMKWRCAEKCSVATKRTSDNKTDDKRHLYQDFFI
jgi:MoaA/NifB/PqqE/SkfB family radical SAM enzyme